MGQGFSDLFGVFRKPRTQRRVQILLANLPLFDIGRRRKVRDDFHAFQVADNTHLNPPFLIGDQTRVGVDRLATGAADHAIERNNGFAVGAVAVVKP